MRIQANPGALATLGLSLDDLRNAIGTANVNQAKGSFDGPLRASTIDANDQMKSAAEVAPISRTPYCFSRRSPRCPIPSRHTQRNFANKWSN